ncbi:hypothetical protein ANASTE_00900 [Anaerofustis stercorihominis DSM 17244]|uniref:Leucine-rich repeat domain-containing protein n=3 Tax=Anaerofustis stercorihominis TaxID=214853 RepID=B1C843_9FIRM|nr:leucine-rich repeat domain-containing protein [Anaerofustis stercorihominis]EDS73180.1 hypothetical protein ANASTE_00900 [Anaerofustis stercorihominis DSM 17244]
MKRNKKITLISIILMTLLIIPSITFAKTDMTDEETSREVGDSITNVTQGKENGYTYRIRNKKAYIISYDTTEESIKSLVIPDKIKNCPVVSIQDEAFKNIPAKSIVIPKSVETIGDFAFYNCSNLEELTIKGSKKINSYAFANCLNLNNVIIEEGTAKIEESAFLNSGMKTISLPSTLKEIGNNVFTNCSNLTDFTVAQNNKTFISIDGVLYSKDKKTLIAYPTDKDLNSYTVNADTKTISNSAFYGNKQLETIILPKKLKTIGSLAFYNTRSLKSIEIPKNVSSVASEAFYGSVSLSNVTLKGTKTISKNAFAECESLTDVKLSDSLTEIKANAFENCTILKNIDLPDSIEIMGASVFRGCISLNKVTIPKSVNYIRDYAFADCTGLTEVDLSTGVTKINKKAFSNCPKLTKFIAPSYNLGFIGKTVFDDSKNVVIYAPYNSYALKYAEENKIKTENIDAEY